MLRHTRRAGLLIAAVAAAALVLPATQAGARGGPPNTDEGAGNNLSVPTYFVPSTTGAPALRTPCPTAFVAASGSTALYNGIAYYLQKTDAVWSAECSFKDSESVTATWGANLTNDRVLKAGRPIRVEMALTTDEIGLGYFVENLTPDVPDRLATYGTQGGAGANMSYMVWASGATLTISQVGGNQVYTDTFTAEVNSTGKVVYGYNWGTGSSPKATAGTYTLTFTVPDAITITGLGADEGIPNAVFTDHTTVVTVVVGAGGGGGGQH